MLDKKFFVSTELVAQKVELMGEKHTLHFAQLPAKEFYKFAMQIANDETRFGATAEFIARVLRNPDDTPALTVEQAENLKFDVMTVICEAAMVVNGAKKN